MTARFGEPNPNPPRCMWHRDDDGNTVLIPGCWARVHDPDAECTCGAWSEDTARKTIRALKNTIYRERDTVQKLRNTLRAAGLPDPTYQSIRSTPADYTARQRRRDMHKAITEAGHDN